MKPSRILRNHVGRKMKTLRIVTSLFLIFLSQAGMTEEFPAKPVTVLIPFAAGGPTDLNARGLAEIAKDFLGQPIVAVSKPGGGGIIAASLLVKEKPDGYTVGIIADAGFVQIPQERDVPYHPLNDFEFIIKHMSLAGGIFCRADKSWKTMKDLIAYSKEYPGKITYATAGAGGAAQIGTQFILTKEGIKWRMVPYDGSPKVVSAVLGGHVDVASSDVMSFNAVVRSGEVRALAIDAMAKRKEFQDVMTFEELGYILSVGATFGMAAPKGTPAGVIKKLHDSFKKAIDDPRYEALCNKLDINKAYASSEEYTQIIKREYEVRGKMLKELGMAKKN
jgi:tripartite-type tricarboxylate transporter receptor subunit TctC